MGKPKKPGTKERTVHNDNGQLYFCKVLECEPLATAIRTVSASEAWGLTGGTVYRETATVEEVFSVLLGSWLQE